MGLGAVLIGTTLLAGGASYSQAERARREASAQQQKMLSAQNAPQAIEAVAEDTAQQQIDIRRKRLLETGRQSTIHSIFGGPTLGGPKELLGE